MGVARYEFVRPYIARALNGETLLFEDHDERVGAERTFEVTYSPQLGEDEQTVVGFHVMRQDISSQQREKKRLDRISSAHHPCGDTIYAGIEKVQPDGGAGKEIAADEFFHNRFRRVVE